MKFPKVYDENQKSMAYQNTGICYTFIEGMEREGSSSGNFLNSKYHGT
jgi:hypothetical protein